MKCIHQVKKKNFIKRKRNFNQHHQNKVRKNLIFIVIINSIKLVHEGLRYNKT